MPTPDSSTDWDSISQILSTPMQYDQEESRGLDGRTDREREARARYNMENRSEFTRGFLGAVDDTQGMAYGAVGALGGIAADAGLPGGQGVRDFGLRGYQANKQEAEINPRRVGGIQDIQNAGDIGTFAAGTAGSLVPFMAETALSALIGAAIGSSASPAGTVAGAAGGAVGKKLVREMIEEIVEGYVKKGVTKALAREMAAREATEFAAK
jgi:hypothetical protein